MSKAIVVAWHRYTPFGKIYYEPLLDYFLQQMEKYQDEYEKIYFLDSTWEIDFIKAIKKLRATKFKIIKVDPSLRYYDAYKKVLPQVEEDLVLFMDNDMVVYKPNIIFKTFGLLSDPSKNIDVVSIYDTCGTYTTDKLNGKNKFCPYWFATRKELLMKYLDVDWGPDMPEYETLGKLTKKMLEDGIKPYELEEDKTDKGKDLGYYHIRAGSTIAYLLASKHDTPEHQKQYWDYLKNQPKSEILRHCKWYTFMGGDPQEIISDLK